jgi:hypothetical protein
MNNYINSFIDIPYLFDSFSFYKQVRHSPVQIHLDQPQPQQQQQQQYLPPMRSLWNESMNNRYSPPPSSNNTNSHHNNNSGSPILNLDRHSPQQPNNRQLSSPRQQLHMLQFPNSSSSPQHQHRDHREDNQRLPAFTSNQSSPIPREILMKEDQPQKQVYPPALDSSWPGSRYEASSFDHEIIKRRKLSMNSAQTVATAAAVADLRHYTSSGSSGNNNNNKKVMTSTRHSANHLSNTNTTLLSSSPATDTYYHQSRRKKRDTKPPNANDIRPFVEVERTKDGNYILPAEVDSWTVLSLGSVIWDRAAFHNQRYIYPVGYRVKK